MEFEIKYFLIFILLVIIFLIIIFLNLEERKEAFSKQSIFKSKKRVNFYTDILIQKEGKKKKNKISVIICNDDKPKYLNSSIPKLSSYNRIGEILIFHGIKENLNIIDDPKVRNFNDFKNYKKFGRGRRILGVSNAKYKYILLLDNNIIPSEDLVERLYLNIKKNPNRLYGRVVRNCNKIGYSEGTIKNFDAVLSGISIISKKLLEEYVSKRFHTFGNWFRQYNGDCEDLGLSLFLKYDKKNKMKYVGGYFKYIENNDNLNYDDNKNYGRRNKFCKLYNKILEK